VTIGPRDPDEEPDDIQIEEGDEGEDAGQLDDESGREASGQDDEDTETDEGLTAEDESGEEPPRRSRATSAVLKARETAKSAAEKVDRLEQEIQELRTERQQHQARMQEETPDQEAARLSLMSAEERLDYKLAKAQKTQERQINMYRFEAVDKADKAAYEAKGSYDPRFKRYGKEVEDMLAVERRAGRDFSRETVLKFVLGQKVLDNAKNIKTQQAAGRKKVASQRTQAGDGRSDHAAPRGRAGRGNSLDDLERRLDGVEI
jgi:hypothetical protein